MFNCMHYACASACMHNYVIHLAKIDKIRTLCQVEFGNGRI